MHKTLTHICLWFRSVCDTVSQWVGAAAPIIENSPVASPFVNKYIHRVTANAKTESESCFVDRRCFLSAKMCCWVWAWYGATICACVVIFFLLLFSLHLYVHSVCIFFISHISRGVVLLFFSFCSSFIAVIFVVCVMTSLFHFAYSYVMCLLFDRYLVRFAVISFCLSLARSFILLALWIECIWFFWPIAVD